MKKILSAIVLALMVIPASQLMAAENPDAMVEEGIIVVENVENDEDFTKASDDPEDYEDGRMYKGDSDDKYEIKDMYMMSGKLGQGRFAVMILVKLIGTLIFLPLVVYLVSRAWHAGAIAANRANSKKK